MPLNLLGTLCTPERTGIVGIQLRGWAEMSPLLETIVTIVEDQAKILDTLVTGIYRILDTLVTGIYRIWIL